jgi:putative ABC transport system permease protein
MSAAGIARTTPAPAKYFDWLSRNRVFEAMAATGGATANLTGDGAPEQIVGRGLALAGAGLALGVLAAWAGTGIMRNLLFGVQPNDPATFVVVTALLLSVSLIASWIPARRATRVDPMTALRAE